MSVVLIIWAVVLCGALFSLGTRRLAGVLRASIQYLLPAAGPAQQPESLSADTIEVYTDTSATSATRVPVVPPTIEPVVHGGSGRDRIITPYRADAFERRLRTLKLLHKHPHLPGRIRHGFPIGNFTPLKKTYAPRNHAPHPRHLQFVKEYINEQVSLGRMTGPYDMNTVKKILKSDFMSSPLLVTGKAGSPGKFRLIQDCSRKNKDGFSVNDFVNAGDFPTEWGNTDEVAQIVATVPPGAQAATLDIDSAFRNIPILPEHKPYLVIQVQSDQFYIDHVCPFGVASGTGLQGQVMDAIVDILTASGIKPIKKWVDDMISFRFPIGKSSRGLWKYKYDVEDIFRLTRDLGVPWKNGKCFPYADQVVYVGFQWNLHDRSVSLPDEKRQTYIAKLDVFCTQAATGSGVSLKETMSITGVLSHLTFVYTHGRAYLTNLTAFIASFPDHKGTKLPPQSVEQDLAWWQRALKVPFSRSLVPRPARRDLEVWVDASASWGIGVIIGSKWEAWKLNSGWDTDGRNIGWVEMVALELACLCLEHLKISNVDIIVHSDKTGVLGAYFRGRSCHPHTNLSIRRITQICTKLNIGLSPEYVDTERNLADSLSRGTLGHKGKRLCALSTLPTELQPFLKLASA